MADGNFARFGARKGRRLIFFILLSVLLHGLIFLIKIDLSTDKSEEESLVSIKYIDDSKGLKPPSQPVLPPKPQKKEEDSKPKGQVVDFRRERNFRSAFQTSTKPTCSSWML